ncbi:hypothetical protein KRX57_06650 [Weeksellaceae bacterium TAE3-ERU29]|nr:hypothetical protein [Weeksellaceae bacterium TAE3-ERU29]
MKKFLTFSFLITLSVVFGQIQYDKGYLSGHKDGYCNASRLNGDYTCDYDRNYPYVETPIPKVGEGNTYKDGYARGLYDGQKDYEKKGRDNRRKPYKYSKPEQVDISGTLGNAVLILQGRHDHNFTLLQNKVNEISSLIHSFSKFNQAQISYIEEYEEYVIDINNRTIDYSKKSTTNALLNYFLTVENEIKSWKRNPNKKPKSLDTSDWDNIGYYVTSYNYNKIKIGSESIPYKYSIGVGVGLSTGYNIERSYYEESSHYIGSIDFKARLGSKVSLEIPFEMFVNEENEVLKKQYELSALINYNVSIGEKLFLFAGLGMGYAYEPVGYGYGGYDYGNTIDYLKYQFGVEYNFSKFSFGIYRRSSSSNFSNIGFNLNYLIK